MNRIDNIRIDWAEGDFHWIQDFRSLGELVQYLADNDLVDKVELVVTERRVDNNDE